MPTRTSAAGEGAAPHFRRSRPGKTRRAIGELGVNPVTGKPCEVNPVTDGTFHSIRDARTRITFRLSPGSDTQLQSLPPSQITLLQNTPDVASAMNHGNYADRVSIWLINDQVGVEREKQDVPLGEIFAAMALPRRLSQGSEYLVELALDPIRGIFAVLRYVLPDFDKVVERLRRNRVTAQPRSARHAAFFASNWARDSSGVKPSPRSNWASPRSIFSLIAPLFS